MELKLEQGDYVPDGAGGFEALDGAQAALARANLAENGLAGEICTGDIRRIRARRGQFPFLPELGSRLYQLGREKPSAREALAFQYVAEALAQETGLAVRTVTLTEEGRGRAALRAGLEWQGTPLSLQMELAL